MRSICMVIALCLMGPTLSFAQAPELTSFIQKGQSEDAEFAFAKKAFSDGFYSLAQENLEDFLRSYPATGHLYEAHLLLGRSLYYQSDLKRSYYELDIVLNAPNSSGFEDSAIYWIGDIYFKGKDYEKALQSYQSIIDNYPASKYSGYAVYSKAWAYYKLGFFEDAIVAFEEVVQKYNFEKIGMESMFKIGECEYLLGKYEDAVKSLGSFIEKYPLSERIAESYYLMGDAGFKRGDHNGSIGYFNRAIAISPRARWRGFALYRTAQGYLKTGNYDESLKRFAECAKNSKNIFLISNSLLGMARGYREKGMAADAMRVCDEIAAKFPKSDVSIEAYYIKANILNGMKRYKEAQSICLDVINKFDSPDKTGKLSYELGRSYLKEAKAKEALTQFETAIANLKNDRLVSGALCKAGDIYRKAGDFDKARQMYDAILNSYAESPWAPHAQFSIGNIFLSEKKYDRAVLSFQSVIMNFPDSGLKERIAFNLAMAYFGKEDFSRAAQEFAGIQGVKARFYLAGSLYNMNKYEDALEIFREVAKSSSDRSFPELAQYQIGWCYLGMNKDMDAVDNFDLFMKRYPDSGFKGDALEQSIAILSAAAQNFEKWKMPDDAARLYKRAEELKRR